MLCFGCPIMVSLSVYLQTGAVGAVHLFRTVQLTKIIHRYKKKAHTIRCSYCFSFTVSAVCLDIRIDVGVCLSFRFRMVMMTLRSSAVVVGNAVHEQIKHHK